ncbi:hypothetical protein M0R89_03525 [Halorussus limi]|uniref:Ig-like domain-containing protein n=1 Tax=Halorussus limi TaxID=2938695 RepID=A0A8U0HVJ8_9EURY|nr:hypothetical protein [Halorussus limi]UPV75145.1 hypothetical protein M0R89_03525 [Halorussus limi]
MGRDLRSSLTRRRLLAFGGSALAASVSGCLSSVPFAGGPPDVREESDPPDRGVPAAITDLSADATVATLAVGRGSDHHQVWVWNATERSREVTVGIAGGADAEPWFSKRYALDAGANLAIDLRESGDYAITVGLGDREKIVEVPESRFDCNESATDVAIRADRIESASISTSEGCGGR